MLGLVNFGLFHMPRLTYNPITNHKWEWEGMGIAHTGMYDVAVLTIALSCTIFDLFHVQNIVILKSRLKVNQVYWKWHHLIDRIKFLFIFHCKYVSIFYGSVTEIFSVEYWRHLEIWVRASFFFLSFFLIRGGKRSLCMPALRPASQAGPMHNPREAQQNNLLYFKMTKSFLNCPSIASMHFEG